MPIVLYVLALLTFCTGTAEFGIVGIIPSVSAEFGVPLPVSGLLITAYALAMIAGAIGVNLIATGHSPRRAILAATALFAVANLGISIVPNFATLLGLRTLSGLSQGAIYGLSTAAASSIVASHLSTRAVALVYVGPTLAMIAGVPLSSVLATMDNWRGPFLVIGIAALGCALALVRTLPELGSLRILHLSAMAGLLREARLRLIYGMTILGFGGSMVAYAFLPATLEEVGGASAARLGLSLSVFGIGAFAGNLLAGWAGDRFGIRATMLAVLAVLGVSLAGMLMIAAQGPLAFAVLFVWGAMAFSLPPLLQNAAIGIARESGSETAGAGLNIAAFNVGIGTAGLAGGLLVAVGDLTTPLLAATIAVLAAIPVATRLR
ncbi:MFS transporter [Salipiger sp. P9]|uniref:MFS transporter n=1 Tax=Salipiger pentaromativorans TaxID=2943193 RepID=UPI002157E14D|nr:MFS transporter [Salipiger pentaromativorans]MCR8548398.1 MFS transporter [Salipiger pentaromativorans]